MKNPNIDNNYSPIKSSGKNFLGYRPEIDGLRALAVLAVIFNHFNKEILPSGYLGVDIFFVISGYVITNSLHKRNYDNFSQFIFGFYERRIKRIIPALVCFIFFGFIFICLFNQEPERSLKTGAFSIIGLSNVFLYKHSTNYFHENVALNPFTQTWSLGVEEQFYFIFPLLIWVTGFAQKNKNGLNNLFQTLLVLSSISLTCFIYFNQVNQPAAYFLMPNRFWEMSAGSIVFLLTLKGIDKFKKLCNYLVLPFFIALVTCFFLTNQLPIPISDGSVNSIWSLLGIPYSTILIVLFTSCLILGLKDSNLIYRLLTNKIIIFIGKISYSLYLWHWGILSISKWTIGIYWWTIPFQVLIIFLISVASFKFVELPFRNLKLFLSNRKTVLNGLLFLLGCFGIFFTSISYLGKSILFTGIKKDLYTDDYSEYIQATNKTCRDIEINPKCKTYSGDQSGNRKIFLMGDSHAAHLIPLIGNIHHKYNFDIIFFTRGGTYPYQYYTNNAGKDLNQNIRINKLRDKAFDLRFEKLNKGDLVLLASSFDLHFFNTKFTFEESSRGRTYFSKNKKIITPYESFLQYLNELEVLSKKAKQRGINIIVFSPIPIFKYFENAPTGYKCAKEWFRPIVPDNCQEDFSIEKIKILERFKSINAGLKLLAQSNKNIYIYDAFDKLCPEQFCYSNNEERKLFRDNNHLSREGSMYLEKHFMQFLENNKLL